ncbi:MAG: polysaccharide pyruvyl transferase family protein [Paludibacteraceae bacterium]|nr:polysaccharide pyruvyl transferase family protein [Paludibacteraceae bacterium]
MKSIGIITIDKCNNYGAELQAYALVKVLQLMKYDSEIIDYLYFKNPKYYACSMSRPIKPQSIKERLICWIKYRLATKLLYFVVPLFSSKMRRRNNRFDKFHKQNTKMSTTYRSMKELYDKVKKYDVYVVGSDQVWNPYTETNLAPYFLQFASKGVRRISYASSFGVTDIPSFAQKSYQQWLMELDFISCRETAGIEIVKKITGKDATLTLDPTLLLDKQQWMSVEGGEIDMPEKFVLIYAVEAAPALLWQMAYEFGEKHNIPIYSICTQAVGNTNKKGIINIEDAGPADFVQLFVNATLVLTNSFHGTAFSCNLGKNFYSVLSKSSKKNSRMTSLLEKLELSNRIVWNDESIPADYGKMYDVEKEQLLLSVERQRSVDYLRNTIEA